MLDSLSGYRTVKCSLIGGEATILRDFPELLEELAASTFPGSIRFDLTTNFSQSAEYYADLVRIIRRQNRRGAKRHLHLTASFYPAYVSREEFSAKALDLIDACSGRSADLRNRLRRLRGKPPMQLPCLSFGIVYPILSDRDYEEYFAMREALAAASGELIRVGPLPIREYHTELSESVRKDMLQTLRSEPMIRVAMADGTEERYRNIRAVGAALSESGTFCPQGYLCDAGMHNLWIDAFGEAFRCPTLGTNLSLGSVTDGTYRPLGAPRVCSSDHCTCNQFGTIAKPAAR